uniref:Iodothyronine deiodinase n=1 Tax=Knipowitschia caucasica TaxID=637954 RepID=A0AAV2JCA5_KNICA
MKTMKAVKSAVVCLVLLPRFFMTALLFWLLDFLCIRRRVFFHKEQDDCLDPPLCISDSNRLFSLESLRAVWHGHKLDFLKEAHLAFESVVQQNADIADSVLVYIEEAHPSDGWRSTDAPYQIPRHRCLEDRLHAARLMRTEVPGCVVVVDSMENASNAAYGAFFDRLYVLLKGRIVYQGGRGPEGYRISELKAWLDQYRQSSQTSTTLEV